MIRVLFVLFWGLIFFIPSVQASLLFEDNFESGLSQWRGTISGSIEVEGNGNHFLSFGSNGRGGDINSVEIINSIGQYTLSFDYKGDPTMGGTPDELGGFVGYFAEDENGPKQPPIWLAGTHEGYVGGSPTEDVVTHLIDNGAWNHYSLNFSAPTRISLTLEDWLSDKCTNCAMLPRDARFDNIRLTAAPEPVSMALFALGGGAMVLLRRRKNRDRNQMG